MIPQYAPKFVLFLRSIMLHSLYNVICTKEILSFPCPVLIRLIFAKYFLGNSMFSIFCPSLVTSSLFVKNAFAHSSFYTCLPQKFPRIRFSAVSHGVFLDFNLLTGLHFSIWNRSDFCGSIIILRCWLELFFFEYELALCLSALEATEFELTLQYQW